MLPSLGRGLVERLSSIAMPGNAWSRARWWTRVFLMHLADAIGRRPRLPPGPLSLSAVARFGDDCFYLNRFRKYGPVFKVWWSRNLTTCVVGLDRGGRLLTEHDRALSPLTVEIESFVPKGFMRGMRGSVHRHYRAWFLSALGTDLPLIHDSELRQIVRVELAELARLRADGYAAPEQIVVALGRVATRMMLVVFFGYRPGDPSFAALEGGFARLGPRGFVYPIGPEQRAAFDALREMVWPIAAKRARDPDAEDGDCVLRRLVRRDVAPKIDETVVGNLIYMIEMGRYDLCGLFRWVVKYLSDHPEVVEDLRSPGLLGAEGTPLAEACVLETLRLDQAEALNRGVEEEFAFDGHRIPQGSFLRILLRESHRDASMFDDPDAFKPGRFTHQKYRLDAYAPFGLGGHRCIASPLVLRLGTLLVEELVGGFDWSVVRDGPRHRGKHHWEPSPQFAISLRPRGPGGSRA
jgi:cytochrome P450